jgi:hypothetical protein
MVLHLYTRNRCGFAHNFYMPDNFLIFRFQISPQMKNVRKTCHVSTVSLPRACLQHVQHFHKRRVSIIIVAVVLLIFITATERSTVVSILWRKHFFFWVNN